MQTHGYIIVNGEKLLVLVRPSGKHWRKLKLRKSGSDGNEFTDEAKWLELFPEVLERLKQGETIRI